MPEETNPADVLEQDGRPVLNADEPEDAETPEGGEADEAAHAESTETEQQKQEKKRLGGWQRKILRTEAERDFWKEEALKNRSRTESKETVAEKPEAPTSKKPTPDQFNTYEEYVEAFADWKAEQKFSELYAKQQQAVEKKSIDERAREVIESYNERVAAFTEEHEDFREKISKLRISEEVGPSLQNALLEDENGPALAYHIATHPEIQQRINEMSSTQALAYLGRLSERMFPEKAQEAEEAAPPSPPPIQKRQPLPPPITPTRKSSPTDKGLSDNLDPKEWHRRFLKEQESWLKR